MDKYIVSGKFSNFVEEPASFMFLVEARSVDEAYRGVERSFSSKTWARKFVRSEFGGCKDHRGASFYAITVAPFEWVISREPYKLEAKRRSSERAKR